MKKSTKLLSVLLAFVMALSCMTMMASAAKAQYQTVANLEALDAYSPYGTVTRLSTEERMSIVFDSLDQLLAPMTNLNMGQLFNVAGLSLSINLTSVNAILGTIDNVKSLLGNFLVSMVKGLLGILADLKTNTWQSGMTREKNSQLQIVAEILELLSANTGLIDTVLSSGISLGVANGALPIDLNSINGLVTNLPNLIKALVFPLMGRQDDDADRRAELSNKSNDLITIAQSFVNGLFTKPMNWTSYRTDATGNDLGYTTALPTSGTSRYFVINGDGTITQWDYQYDGVLGDPVAGYVETVTYTMEKEFDTADCTTYIYKAPEGFEGDETLKWYKAEGVEDANGNVQSGYWLPSVKEAFENGSLTLAINGSDSVAGLLYKFIPYIFGEMAPIVLNGSVKKAIAEAFNVQFTMIGNKGDDTLPAGEFFTKAQEYYTWEYSDFAVIDGVPYYRFQDQFFQGEIPSDISDYYYMINWDFKVPANFMNKYIPDSVGGTSAAGYTHILDALNVFVKDLIDLVIEDEWTVNNTTYTRNSVFPWVAGGNDKLIDNLKNCARNVFNIAPEQLVDEYVTEAQFYNAMMNGTTAQAVNGLVCELVKLIMPQIVFADNIINQPITAIAAIVVRELATQLMPTYNFDAMIYTDYNNRNLVDGTADYWLDTTLYMGVNLGMYYLRNIADVGEDSPLGYYQAMATAGAIPAATPNGMTFTAKSQYVGGTVNSANASWLYMVDWIIDWALEADYEWCWHFERFVDLGTVDLATYQNPFNKLNTLLLMLLPFDQLLNTSYVDSETCVYGSDTFLEKVLKNGLVNCIVALDLDKLQGGLEVPNGYFTQGNIADSLVKIIANLLNNILYKVAGNKNIVDTATIKSVATLVNHNNLKTTVKTLVGALYTAYGNGLLDPVLPIVNFFLGWTTDPQKFADPSIYFANDWNSTYLHADNNPSIKIANTSSGMLLKHRNSDTVDSPYSITITNIEFTNGVSLKGTTVDATHPLTVTPGELSTLQLTLPANSTAFKVTITYRFTGKDGTALGGDQTQISYGYASAVGDQMSETWPETDIDYWGKSETPKYVFTKDIYTSATEFTVTVGYRKPTIGSATRNFGYVKYKTTAPAPLATYFDLITNRVEGGYPSSLKDGSDPAAVKFFKPKTDVTADMFTDEFATANNLYGIWDGGSIEISYTKTSWGRTVDTTDTVDIDFIYYNDYNIGSVVVDYVNKALQANQFTNQTAFDRYEAALYDAVALANVAMRTDYATTVQPNIPDAIEELEAAYEDLMNYSSSSSSSSDSYIDIVKAKLDAIENRDNGEDWNFQDHQLFEYFKYEEQRTHAREMIAACTAPSQPEKYIENEDASQALIEAIVAAQADADVKTGINATVITPDEIDIEFTPANYSELECLDQAAKLQYYYNFMAANKKTADKTFLDKEIAYAQYQDAHAKNNEGEEVGRTADMYSTDSWARYTKALAAAQAASANATLEESKVFDAKYELMVAQNELKLKERSMKESGYMAEELLPLIDHANAILANFGDGEIYSVVDGKSDDEALGQLVKALGVAYEGLEIDGKTYDGILYSRSALTFRDYDRTLTAKNKRAVDAASDKLRAAIENFTANAILEAEDVATTTVDQTIRFIQGIIPGSIGSAAALDARVKITGITGANKVVSASKANFYGTGARVEIKKNDILLATYFVVIYGDVNGDGAVDAMDAIEVDLANCTSYYMGDVYDDAADLTGDGSINEADYAALVAGIQCSAPINQNPTAA